MRYLRAVAAGLLSLALASTAVAHALLERADPRAGSKTRAAPTEVRLSFTERLEPAYSSARVTSASGDRVDRGDARIDAANATTLRVPLKPLAPGTYRVRWRVVSVDTHVTEGDYTFTVEP